jgi:hypothetical protein
MGVGRMVSEMVKKTLELYNLIGKINGRTCAVGNGYLVRVVENGKTEFVKFGSDKAAARAFAKEGV